MGDDQKQRLDDCLEENREALRWKVEGLSEYDVRRPLTRTGTNLLGLVKHLAIVEARYFGDTFGRPFLPHLPWWPRPANTNQEPHDEQGPRSLSGGRCRGRARRGAGGRPPAPSRCRPGRCRP